MNPRQRALQELEQLISRGVGSQVLGLKEEPTEETPLHEEAELAAAETTDEIDPAALEKLKMFVEE